MKASMRETEDLVAIKDGGRRGVHKNADTIVAAILVIVATIVAIIVYGLIVIIINGKIERPFLRLTTSSWF